MKMWLKFAERDLRSARKNYEIWEYHVSVFLAQQAVEKALKALHIKKTGDFPKIHDLTRLARMIDAPNEIVRLCAEITPAYTATRHPDVAGDFSREEVDELNQKCGKSDRMGEKIDLSEVEAFLRRINKKFRIKKAVIFGSSVRGDYGKYSDVDLIVVSDVFRELSPLKRPVNLYPEWDLDYPVDFICYTPEEFEKLSKRPSLVREALKEGKVVEFG